MGMRVEDVADTMKLSRRMVELHITRARAALRKLLQDADLN
jgi:DNA-directed RNA polymerase specialized sigma24 family protein